MEDPQAQPVAAEQPVEQAASADSAAVPPADVPAAAPAGEDATAVPPPAADVQPAVDIAAQQAALDQALGGVTAIKAEAVSQPAAQPQQTVLPERLASSKASLQQTKVYDHLSQVILKILQLKPSDPYRDFELLSQLVKQEKDFGGKANVAASETRPEERLCSDSVKKIVKDPRVVTAEVPDLLTLSSLFAEAGFNMSHEETYRLLQGLKKVEEVHETKSIRFFGKLFGLRNDYYVVESERTTTEEQPTIGDIEMEQGVGVNKYVYFVSTTGMDNWKKLPDAQPTFISKSRKIRKLLTGNLDTKIVCHPPFEGTEADYLRAIIARITSSTVISPNGYYKFDDDEDNKTLVLNTDFEWPAIDSLTQLDNWIHHIPYVLPQGRVTYVKPKPKKPKQENAADEEQNDEQSSEEEQPGETGPNLLTAIAEDQFSRPASLAADPAAPADLPPVWSVRMTHQHLNPKHSAVILRNNLWFGAVTVGFNDKFANLYVGWGLKDIAEPYISPDEMERVQTEAKFEESEQTEADAPPSEEPKEDENGEQGGGDPEDNEEEKD